MTQTNSHDPQKTQSKQVLPYGTWPSGLSAEQVAHQGQRPAEPLIYGNAVYWLESRPQEQGRVQIVQRLPTGELRDLLPEGFSARSKVHEYGGGSYLVQSAGVVFVNAQDQRIYRHDFDSEAPPLALTAEAAPDKRFADLQLDPQRRRVIAVCEDHGAQPPANTLVAIPLDGSGTLGVLAAGADFYSSPRLSPDGRQLLWLSWNHPNMPWDSTELWRAELDEGGGLNNSRCIAGASGRESIFQPLWSPRGDICFVSDRSNWWNLYRLPSPHLAEEQCEAVTQIEGEFATPQWTFNMSTYGFLDEETVLAAYSQAGQWHLVKVSLRERTLVTVPSPFTQFSALDCTEGKAVLLAASPATPSQVVLWQGEQLEKLCAIPSPLAEDQVSLPRNFSFPTSEHQEAHAFFYPPTNAGFAGPEGDKPPVIVIGHGGPTGATETAFNAKIQYWTNRGFAVLDVNYRGSTGYGRRYRQALYGNWGVRDLDDLCAAVTYAIEQGWVHPDRSIIKGSSAGGYTALAALTFRDRFNAGVSLYGVGDLERLAQDTHKFEARYLDSLVGPYPAERERYRRLSPIHHIDQLNCPLLVFQGLEDKVVPPNQAETVVKAAAARGLPVAYATYPEEGHGFRQAKTICHMLAAEEYFYQTIFGLKQTDRTRAPIEIQNLDAWQ